MHPKGPHDATPSGLQGLADALWAAGSQDVVQWCKSAAASGILPDFDPAAVASLLANPPKPVKDVMSRLRLLALTLLDLHEYRLQALVWQACAARGMDPRNAQQRVLYAMAAQGNWAGVVQSGGFLLAQPDVNPQWAKMTKDAVVALLGAKPAHDDLIHVLRQTGLRFAPDILDRLGDRDPIAVFLACDLTDAQMLQLSATFAHRSHTEHAVRLADILTARGPMPVYAALARAARASATGLLNETHTALTQANYTADLPGMALWNWATLAAACGHPSLPLIVRRIVKTPSTLAMLAEVLAELGPDADEAGSLLAALVEAGADPMALLDIRLSSGATLTETDAKAAIALVEQDTSDRQTDRIIALTRQLLDHSQLRVSATAEFCRRQSASLCSKPAGAGLLARSMTMVQDWDGSLVALEAVLRHGPDALWALVRAYFSAARLGRDDLAQSYLSRINLDAAADDPALLTVAHGACLLGDYDLGRRILDQMPATAPGSDLHNHAGRLRVVLTGDASALQRDPTAESYRPQSAPAPRVLVIDPGFGKDVGHHFSYNHFATGFFAAELGTDPEQVWVCGRRGEALWDTSDADQLRKSLHQIFDFNPYTFEDFPKTPVSLGNLSLAWQTDLTRGLDDADLSQVQVIYCHSMKANMATGFANWMAGRFAGQPVCVIVGVIEVDYLSEGEAVSAACNASYAAAVQTLRAIPGVDLTFYAETTYACTHLSLALNDTVFVHNIPYLAASLAGPAAATHLAFSKKGVTIGLVGGSRRERGLDIFPELMLAFCDRPEVHWVLQMSRKLAEQIDPVFPVYLDWASAQGICTWHSDRLESEAYYDALRQMDIVLMPYRDRYAVSGSGVFYEALQLERYLIVPQATFMHDVLVDWAYPCTFLSGTSVFVVARALTKVLKDKATLHQNMQALRAKQGDLLPLGKFRTLLKRGLAATRGPA